MDGLTRPLMKLKQPIPIGSMGLVYLPTFGSFLWQNVGKYTIQGGCYGLENHHPTKFHIRNDQQTTFTPQPLRTRAPASAIPVPSSNASHEH